MFREAFVREGFDFDFMYDWNVKKAALKQRIAESTAKKMQESGQQYVPKNSNTAQQPQRAYLESGKKMTTPIEQMKPPIGQLRESGNHVIGGLNHLSPGNSTNNQFHNNQSAPGINGPMLTGGRAQFTNYGEFPQ